MAVDPAGPDPDAVPEVPMFALGRIGRPHTLDGSFAVTRPRADLLVKGLVLTVAGVEREVTRRGGTNAKPVLHLAGLDGIAAVEALRGTDLLIPRDTLPALDEEEYWPHELVGLPVTATTGEAVGEVAEVLVLPSVDVLQVRRPPAPSGDAVPDLLVPLHREAVPELDVPGRLVVIDLVFLDEEPTPDVAGAEHASDDAPDPDQER